MKLALLVLTFAFSMQAHAADNDTIVVHKPNKVTVVAGDSVQKILIEGREGDEKYVYRNTVMLGDDAVRKTSFDKDTWDITPSVKIGKNKKDEGDEAGMHIAFGQVSPVSADDRLDFSRNSFEIWWIPLCYEHAFDKQKRHILEFGLGLDWRNYRIRQDVMFVKNADGMVDLAPYPSGVQRKFSRVKVFGLTADVLYRFWFSKKFGMALGPVLNFNTYSSIKTKYKEDGKKVSVIDKKVGHRPVTVDLLGMFDINGLNIYVKYSPNDVLKDNGIKFKALSFGVLLD